MSTGTVSTTQRRIVVFLLLFGGWLVFSGHFDAMHLGLGIVSTGLVTAVSTDLLLPASVVPRGTVVWRFLAYLPWLLWEVVRANLHVVWLILRPGEIRPQMVRFTTSLRGDVAKVAFGTSITLTPGTVTMDVNRDEFFVHALSDHAAQSLLSGSMERRVAHVFGETAPGRRAPDEGTS